METYSPVSNKDSMRVVMAIIAHYYFELYQMDVKTTFLNDEFHEEVYIDQPEGFHDNCKQNMICWLNKPYIRSKASISIVVS